MLPIQKIRKYRFAGKSFSSFPTSATCEKEPLLSVLPTHTTLFLVKMSLREPVKMLLIVVSLLCLIGLFQCASGSDKQVTIISLSREEIDRKEFTLFCELGFMIRDNQDEALDTKECAVTEPESFDHDEDLPMLFTLIMMFAWGATVRAIAKRFQIKTPYTVLLLISGAIVGGFSHDDQFCAELHQYTAIARISPHHILYIFLPILIFESAFSISVHTFTRSFGSILILAFPGMLISTGCTAVICYQFFADYNWNWLVALLFGSIICATDPVAVVAILRELGVSEKLGVLIDGESLMNDGVAILLFEIFHEYLTERDYYNETNQETALHVTIQFVRIAIGGPVWGWLNGKLAIYNLSYIYNDAAVEISTTICAAYLTYWSSEYVLGCSGVLAVVVLGITLSAERTVISPESEGPVHHFWEMLGYLANTVLFILVGIVITETAITHFDPEYDIPYLILLYVALHVVRFMMLLMFYPILKRIGYGLEWQSLIVIMWGGLRGAVGICLALQIYEDEHLCANPKIGPKILFHTSGIVLLTLVINGTTTKGLLKTLKLTDVTTGQREEMNNAVRRIQRVKWNLMRSMQMGTRMFDAHWDIVENICRVRNPYALKSDGNETKINIRTLQPPRPIKDNSTVCWHCSNIVENEPTVQEYRDMTNDARLRAIKSMKIHYHHMFEKGTLTEQATQLLLVDAEHAEDNYLQIIHADNFHKYMKAHGIYVWIRDKIIIKFKLHKAEKLAEPPAAQWRQCYFRLVHRDWFEVLCIIVIIFNTITVVWDFVLVYASEYPNMPCKWTENERKTRDAFTYTSYVFCAFYTFELILRLIGNKFSVYFCSIWNYVDLLVLILTYVDVYLDQLECDELPELQQYLSLFRILRLCRCVRLLRPVVPHLIRKIKRQLNLQVFIGYDMGKGFVETSDAVIKFIPQLAENKKVQHIIRTAMKRERNACVNDLALIHSKFPGVVTALKTRHACRATLNKMQFALTEIRDGGLLDDAECLLLKRILEEKIKRLNHSPTYMVPPKLNLEHGLHRDDEEANYGISKRR